MPGHKMDTTHPAPLAVPPSAPSDPTRERLLATAVDLFTRRGYAATSVREIVEGAGVTKPALYYHFGSKEGLYEAILDRIERLIEEALAEHRGRGGSARERVEALFVSLFDLFEKNQSAVRFINAVFWGPPQGAPPFDFEQFHARLRDAVGAIVADGIASGELGSHRSEDVVLALIGVLSFSMDLTLAHPELGLGKAGLRRALDLLFTGVAAPGTATSESKP